MNRLKLINSPYYHLIEDDKGFHAWLQNLERGSVNTASVSLRKIGYTCDTFRKTPQEIASMNAKQATEFILDVIARFEKEGKRGSTIESYVKVLKNWMSWNDITISRKIKIDSSASGLYDTEVVPTAEELTRILSVADIRTKVAISLMAFCGVRPEVMGNLVADDGLKVGDLPELKLNGGRVEFAKTPTMVVIRKALSKAGHSYFVFLPELACEYLRTYLEMRAEEGERVGPSSPMICAIKHKEYAHIVTPNITYEIKKAITKAGFNWRPYVLRRYFEVKMMDAEQERLILREWRVFWMGHAGDIEATYSVNKGLATETVERMREAYAKAASKYLLKMDKTNEEAIKQAFKKQMLAMVGFTNEQIEKLDFDQLTNESLQQMVREKLLGVMANNGNRQRVAPISDVKELIPRGWEYVAQLPTGEAIVKLPF